jgi:hypothetical protein
MALTMKSYWNYENYNENWLVFLNYAVHKVQLDNIDVYSWSFRLFVSKITKHAVIKIKYFSQNPIWQKKIE